MNWLLSLFEAVLPFKLEESVAETQNKSNTTTTTKGSDLKLRNFFVWVHFWFGRKLKRKVRHPIGML